MSLVTAAAPVPRDARVVPDEDDAPLSAFAARRRFAVRVVGIVVGWALAFVADLAAKLVRIVRRVFVLWPVLVVMLVLLIGGAVAIELQTDVQHAADVVYDCGVYKAADATLRNVLLPFVRVPYEFTVVRLNDANIYARHCVAQLAAALLAIDEPLSAGGLVDAFCAFVEFVADCAVRFVTDICSWRVPFVSETLQNALNIFPCSLRFAKGVVEIVVYVVESSVAAEFDFVVFKQLCAELVDVFRFCASNVLELFTLENTIGPLLEYVAANPFTVDLGGGTVFNSTVLLPASFDHSASFVPVFTDGALELATCAFVFVKNTFVSIVTGTLIANEAYVCRRLNYCDAAERYPWYVPPLFVATGAVRVTDATVLYNSPPIVEELFTVLVPNRRYSRERYPRNELLDVVAHSNAASEVRAVQHLVFTPARLLDNCGAIGAAVLNDTVDNGEVPVPVPCAMLDAAELARTYTIVVRTRYRRSGAPAVGTRERFEFNPGNATYTAADIGTIVEPVVPGAFAFAQRAFPEPPMPRAITFRVDSAPLPEQPVVRCDATVSFFGQLFECAFSAVDLVVTTFVAAANFFAQIGAVASGGAAGDATPFADLGTIDDTLEQLKELVQEDPTRPFCRVGLANTLTFKPSLYAALRLTDCDTDGIGALWQADTFEDGLVGCTVALANVFAEPDFTDAVQFFKFLIVALGQETVGGTIVLTINSFTCLGRPDVVACVDAFPVYTADTNTTGSCTAVLADIEDDDDDDDGVNDRPLAGLGGCIKLWRDCVRSESEATPGANSMATPSALAAFNTFEPLFDAAVGFGTNFLDPVVCPFIVAAHCSALANTDPSAAVACPIPMPLPPAEGDRTLLCGRYAMCCWLGQDVGVNGVNPLPGNPGFSIRFVGTGWLEIIGLLGKGTIDLVIFVASFDDAVRDVFNELANVFSDDSCNPSPNCTVTDGLLPFAVCVSQFLTVGLFDFFSICLGQFPARLNIAAIIGALPDPPDLAALGAELDLRHEPLPPANYTLPPYNKTACAAGVVGDERTLIERHAAHEAYVNYALRAEAALIAAGVIGGDDLWSDAEFATTLAQWRPPGGGNESHICAFYGTGAAARVVYTPADGAARMHVFRSRTLSRCECTAYVDKSPFATPLTLESLLLNVPLLDTGGGEALGEYAACECALADGSVFSLRNVTRAYYNGLLKGVFAGGTGEHFAPGSACAETMRGFDAFDMYSSEQQRAFVTLTWCTMALNLGTLMHERQPQRYARNVLLGDPFVAGAALLDFAFAQLFGPASTVEPPLRRRRPRQWQRRDASSTTALVVYTGDAAPQTVHNHYDSTPLARWANDVVQGSYDGATRLLGAAGGAVSRVAGSLGSASYAAVARHASALSAAVAQAVERPAPVAVIGLNNTWLVHHHHRALAKRSIVIDVDDVDDDDDSTAPTPLQTYFEGFASYVHNAYHGRNMAAHRRRLSGAWRLATGATGDNADDSPSIADVWRGRVQLRKRRQALGPSLALGRWAHARRVRRQQRQEIRKRSADDAGRSDALAMYAEADERRAQHVTAHTRFAANMARQERALRTLVAAGAYAYNASEVADYERHMQCRHYIDAHNNNNAFRALPDAERRARFCERLLARVRAERHDPTHGHLFVERDAQRFFYHRYVSEDEFGRAHVARGAEHVRALLRHRVLAAIVGRSGVARVTRTHIDNVYATGDFARSAADSAAAFEHAVWHNDTNHRHRRRRRRTLHARQPSPGAVAAAALSTARAVAEPVFVATLNFTYGVVNACLDKKGVLNATRTTGDDFVADVAAALFGTATPLVAPASFEEAFASVLTALDALVDGVAALFADPVAHVEEVFDGVLDLVVCDIPGDFDGSGGYYNPFCLAAGFLPEALFVGVLEPLPTAALPKQIPWPAGVVAARTANVRIVDEGAGMLLDNDRFNDCVRAADPDPLDANAVPPCERCDDLFDDDDDVLASKCTPNGTLDVGWRRDVRLFTALTETGALLVELAATGALPPDAADFTLDPNSNCNVTEDEFGVAIPRPFCGQCDYTPGAYESCRDDLGWADVADSWLFFVAKLPVLLNRLTHPRSLTDIVPLLAVVFPLPFTLYVPELEVAGLAWSVLDTVASTLRVTQITVAVLSSLLPAVVSVAAWATRFLGLVSTAINIIPIVGPAIALFTTAIEYTVAVVLRGIAIGSVLVAFPLRTWLGRYYFVHLVAAGAVWLAGQCVEFGTLRENAALKLLCDALFHTRNTALGAALGLAPALGALSERAQRYKAPADATDVFCFYWTAAQNWIAGWLLIALVLLVVRLLVFAAWRLVVIVFTLSRESQLQTERLAGIGGYNRSLRNQSGLRAIAAVAFGARARLAQLLAREEAAASVAVGATATGVGGGSSSAVRVAPPVTVASELLGSAASADAEQLGGYMTERELEALAERQRAERRAGHAAFRIGGARLRAHERAMRRASWSYYVGAPLRRLARATISAAGGTPMGHAHDE